MRWLLRIHLEKQLPDDGARGDVRDAVVGVVAIVAGKERTLLVEGSQGSFLHRQTVTIDKGRGRNAGNQIVLTNRKALLRVNSPS